MDRTPETSWPHSSRSPTHDKSSQQEQTPSSSSGTIAAPGSPVLAAAAAARPIRSDTLSTHPVSRESRTSSIRHAPMRQQQQYFQPISHASGGGYIPSMRLESAESPGYHTDSGSSSSRPLPPLPATKSDEQRMLSEGTPISPLPKAMQSSRNTVMLDNEADETFHDSPYDSTAVSRLRRMSLGAHQAMERLSSALPTSMRSGTGTTQVEEKHYREKTVSERLDPTLRHAMAERKAAATKARLTGYALNIAIGLQVLLGTLTTALSVVLRGSQETATMTAILGGLSTVVASYLARTRGSNEPELSITRVKDLEHFIRECEALNLDRGHLTGEGFDAELERLRDNFEELLGNGNGERKLSPPT